MAAKTKIEWADSTLNFWIGCTKVSPACDHCYAESEWANRKKRVVWGPHGDRSPTKTHLAALKWQKAANDNGGVDPDLGRRRRVFVNSLSDSFDNHRSIDRSGARQRMWDTIRACPDVIFMLLTKRPQNILKMLPADWGDGWPNVWIGTTVENQEEADRRIPHLLKVPARYRFLSMEPLLGAVDIRWALGNRLDMAAGFLARGHFSPGLETVRPLDWVIVGGESGPDARPSHPVWIKDLRDQCVAAGAAFFFKQWGEWKPVSDMPEEEIDRCYFPAPGRRRFLPRRARVQTGVLQLDGAMRDEWPTGAMQIFRAGKQNTGRLLDGRSWSEFPDERKAA